MPISTRTSAFSLPFAENEPLTFLAQPVQNFGFREAHSLPEAVFKQVEIYDYKSADDYIVKLQTKVPDDELILAKITPANTFQETVADVLKRMGKASRSRPPPPISSPYRS